MIAVTVVHDGVIDGSLVGFHCQCSIAPQRYAVWLSDKNRTSKLAQRAEYLAVHSLSASARELAVHLGTVTLDEHPDKMESIPLAHDQATGAAVLEGADGWFIGRVIERIPAGDHTCFVIEPVSGHAPTDTPRLRFQDVADLDAGHEA
jgi:flavin reductase (DIM6/NTAB) family NADH-FMN oxidoreductase RutF